MRSGSSEIAELSGLDDLADTAWGDGSLGLHRGHMPIDRST